MIKSQDLIVSFFFQFIKLILGQISFSTQDVECKRENFFIF